MWREQFLICRKDDQTETTRLLSDEQAAHRCRRLSNSAVERSNCLRHPSTAAPRRLCWPTGSRPSCWSSWSTLGSRRRASRARSPADAGSKSSVCALPRLAGGRSRSFDGPDPQARVREPRIRRMSEDDFDVLADGIVIKHLEDALVGSQSDDGWR